MNDSLRPFLLTILAVLGGLVALLVVTLVLVHLISELLERRARRRSDALRGLILATLLGEPEESAVARAALLEREGRAWQQVEQQGFAMLPKIKGDAHEVLVLLLRSRGAADHAYANARARSSVRRSRGAYQLGALGDPQALPTLVELLASKHFLVRRTAVRALGQLRDAAAVGPLLDAVTADPALVRDVVAALQRIGSAAVPHLRRDLVDLVEHEDEGRRGALVATVLGLNGDLASVGALVSAVEQGRRPAQRAAAAEALGEIGSPAAVPALVAAVAEDVPEVRIAAAEALGKISDVSAVPALTGVLGSGIHELDRAAATALLRVGGPGLAVLESHPSAYAREALALHLMRTPA